MRSFLAKLWKWRFWFLLGIGIVLIVAWRNEIAWWLKQQFPRQTKWDYLEKVLVPVASPAAIGFGVWYLDKNAKDRESQREQNENKNQSLQKYFESISAILLDKQVISLAEAAKKPDSSHEDPLVESARGVIRAHTLSILRVFSNDVEKKSSVVRFLIDSGILSDLRVSLREAYLNGLSLPWANLSRAHLVWADLSGAKLLMADLRGANIFWANLHEANLSMSNLSGATLIKANLNNAILGNVNFRGANLTETQFIQANLDGADFSDADLNNADLSLASLLLANFNRANLNGANFNKANLLAANFNGANLKGANFSGANLQALVWNEKTIWPSSDRFKAAKNISDHLKTQLGL